MRSTRELSEIMEFDHVVRVQSGVVTDDNVADLYAPECLFGAFEDGRHIEPNTGWTLLAGFTGQYHGPLMHASEYIGGRLENYILTNDGHYVALVCYVLGDNTASEEEPAGWCVAFRPLDK